jgi:uncharacterized protein YjbI with pentapeptide repeats
MILCSKLPCLGLRSADFLQGFFAKNVRWTSANILILVLRFLWLAVAPVLVRSNVNFQTTDRQNVVFLIAEHQNVKFQNADCQNIDFQIGDCQNINFPIIANHQNIHLQIAAFKLLTPLIL